MFYNHTYCTHLWDIRCCLVFYRLDMRYQIEYQGNQLKCKEKCITLAPSKSICLLKVSVLRVTLRSVLDTAESQIAFIASKIIACHWGGECQSLSAQTIGTKICQAV